MKFSFLRLFPIFFCISSVSTASEIWKETQIPLILHFGVMDFRMDYCSEGDVKGCAEMMAKMEKMRDEYIQIEKAFYKPQMSRSQAINFIEKKETAAKSIVDYFRQLRLSAQKEGRTEYAELLEIIEKKVELVRSQLILPKKKWLATANENEDFNRHLLGQATQAEVELCDKVKASIKSVIEDPGIGTVRDVVEAAKETMEVYKQNGILNQDYYSEESRQLIMSYYDKGIKAWDRACWICGRADYVEAAHSMINFGLLVGGGSKDRFAPLVESNGTTKAKHTTPKSRVPSSR